ncbi:MAG: hypothetical protein L0211_03980 [Planctomycetaceae bacterium]|nr:hypothetical protein [Planctomycetaceae bacterium]
MPKPSSADDVKLMSSYETVKATLLSPEYSDRLDRPLAFWALPNDRRLPTAFLGRTLRDLLHTPFPMLAATAGIGRKKLMTFVKLLVRATKDESNGPDTLNELREEEAAPITGTDESGNFDPGRVSEVVWAKWRGTARQHAIGQEQLGRLAPSLATLPTVIWTTPLNFYLDQPLGDIRRLKTHGEKRVNVVLEVFHNVHQLLSHVDQNGGLAVRLAPRNIAAVEDWMAEAKGRSFPPGLEEVEQSLVEPLLRQLEIDVGDTVSKLARGRLGVGAKAESVRNQSKALGVTRARVYQLLEECNHVMTVRWPEGRRLLDAFAQWLDENYASADVANLLASLREMLYPLKFDSVAEHLRAEARS